jgi:uncharacterized membrane protein YkoI
MSKTGTAKPLKKPAAAKKELDEDDLAFQKKQKEEQAKLALSLDRVAEKACRRCV